MKLIVGLGNPGEKFKDTRHNIGFMVVDRAAANISMKPVIWEESQKHKALLYRTGESIFVKPQTFMNNVGISVSSLVSFYKLDPSSVWVVHDDMDLPLGKIRIREQGGSAGHHGVDSIISFLKTDAFVRFRLGIGRGKESTGASMNRKLHHSKVISFVLSRFRDREEGELHHLIKSGAKAIETALIDGVETARNLFH